MALSCSFIIASPQARFADTHAKVGLFPRWGQAALLPNVIGTRRAKQMMLTGAFITAETACDWGLVNEISSGEMLLDRCLEIAGQIASANRDSIRTQMGVLRDVETSALAPGLDAERLALFQWDRYR
jgi:enoyl-CoA hydratase